MIKNCLIPTKENNYKPYFLRKVAVITYSFILVFVNSFGAFIGLEEANASSITAQNIISLTNQERESRGLNTLAVSAELTAAALAKANNMFDEQYWSHYGPNGETPWQFIRAAGYDYIYAGENLAKGFQTSEGIHEAWMASETHKANIVSTSYNEIGVAVVTGTLLGKETTLVVQMFGNKTSEIYGATTEETTDSNMQIETIVKEVTVNEVKEEGEISSIRITSPINGAIVTDPSTDIKGEVEGAQDSYIVEVYEEDSLVGYASSDIKNWEFSKNSDWAEGDHNLKANVKGTEIWSDSSSFVLDSTAPRINTDSIQVTLKNDIYNLSFTTTEDCATVNIILGTEIISVQDSLTNSTVEVDIEKSKITNTVTVQLVDANGNSSEQDITEYFKTNEEKKSVIPTMHLGIDDGISIGIVTFVFVLLFIEMIYYLKNGWVRKATTDLFTIGAWWLIIAVAIFTGYSGVIN